MFRKAIIFLLLLTCEAFVTPCGVRSLTDTHLKEDFSVALQIDHALSSGKARDIGFNYELAGLFADYNGVDAEVVCQDSVWRRFRDGECRVLVKPLKDTSSRYGDCLYSVPLIGRYVWCVGADDFPLLTDINMFFGKALSDSVIQKTAHRHFRSYRDAEGAISPYDAFIKRYGAIIGMDWRMLSAIIYTESHFNQATVSRHKAKGLMQIKDATARKYGISDVFDPQENIKAGSYLLRDLMRSLKKSGISDEDNLLKFTLASYNAGQFRIEDCRKKAAEIGLDAAVWEDVVKAFDSIPDFSGRQTLFFIDSVLEKYAEYVELTEKKEQLEQAM